MQQYVAVVARRLSIKPNKGGRLVKRTGENGTTKGLVVRVIEARGGGDGTACIGHRDRGCQGNQAAQNNRHLVYFKREHPELYR